MNLMKEKMRHVLRNSVKRKASDDISQKPSKLIRKALQEQEEEKVQKPYPPLHNFH
jgi:hypothetical protein